MYGLPEESLYCQLFDNSHLIDDERFVVEIRRGRDNKIYAYYSYCRYANVHDIDGRKGAYIGMTIRLDEYYSNLRNVYTILENVFYKKVVGLILKKTQYGFQYLISDFKNISQLMPSNVEKPVGILLSQMINPKEVFPLDASFNLKGGELLLGIDDNASSVVCYQAVKQYSKLIFSSNQDIQEIVRLKKEYKEATNLSEKNHQDILAKQKSDYENKLNNFVEIVRIKDDLIQQYQSRQNELIERVSSLEKKITQTNSEENQSGGQNSLVKKPGDDSTSDRELMPLETQTSEQHKIHCEQIEKGINQVNLSSNKTIMETAESYQSEEPRKRKFWRFKL